MKTYNTGGGRTWQHGQPTDFHNGQPFHVLLGPCPSCGMSCFDYGGGWRCQAHYCMNSASNPAPNVGPHPDWWNTNINVVKDGNAWCAHFDDFINLQESVAAFGDTPQQAVDELRVLCPGCGAKKDVHGEREHEAGCEWFERHFQSGAK